MVMADGKIVGPAASGSGTHPDREHFHTAPMNPPDAIHASVVALTAMSIGSPCVSSSFVGLQPLRAQVHTSPIPLPVLVQYAWVESTANAFTLMSPWMTVGAGPHPPLLHVRIEPSVPNPLIPTLDQ